MGGARKYCLIVKADGFSELEKKRKSQISQLRPKLKSLYDVKKDSTGDLREEEKKVEMSVEVLDDQG